MMSTPGTPSSAPPPFQDVSVPETHRWPGVVGTIAIIFGIAGVLQGGCGMVASLFGSQMYESMSRLAPQSADQMAAQQAVNERFFWVNTGLSLLSMLVATVLLVGGIQLLRRRATSATLLRLWAAAKLVLAILLAGAGWVIFQAQMEWMQAEQNTSGASPDLMRGVAIFGIAISLLWQWALPLFLIVWFSRAPIRASVARWN